MKVLVTGGSGYFGSLLVDKLLKRGFDVGSLDINKPDNSPREFSFHQVDIRDYDSLKKNLTGYDVIFHNVAQVPLAKDKKLFWDVNVKGTENICKASIANNVHKIVYTSSSAIYGVPKKNPVDENIIPTPHEAYGRAKLEGEKICQDFSKKYDLNISIIRPRTIVGHGRLGIFSILFKWVNEGVNIPVLGNGDNIYQFVHAEDLADACILAAENDLRLSSYNIGASDYGTMRETLENLCEYADTGSKVYSLPLRTMEILMTVTSMLRLTHLSPYHSLMYGRSLYFDINKAKRELGYSPKHNTSKMFCESYDWFINNGGGSNYKMGGSLHQNNIPEAFLKILRLF